MLRCDPGLQPLIRKLLRRSQAVLQCYRLLAVQCLKACKNFAVTLREVAPVAVGRGLCWHSHSQALKAFGHQVLKCRGVLNDPCFKPLGQAGRHSVHRHGVQRAIEEQGVDYYAHIGMVKRYLNPRHIERRWWFVNTRTGDSLRGEVAVPRVLHDVQ